MLRTIVSVIAVLIALAADPVSADDEKMKVTNPAFGYRVDWNGHRVVLSGDTTLHENVIKHGTGADLIVHNVIAFSDRLSQMPEMKGVLAKLTTPEQAAEVSSGQSQKLPSIRIS
jgi:ribonuclease Z